MTHNPFTSNTESMTAAVEALVAQGWTPQNAADHVWGDCDRMACTGDHSSPAVPTCESTNALDPQALLILRTATYATLTVSTALGMLLVVKRDGFVTVVLEADRLVVTGDYLAVEDDGRGNAEIVLYQRGTRRYESSVIRSAYVLEN